MDTQNQALIYHTLLIQEVTYDHAFVKKMQDFFPIVLLTYQVALFYKWISQYIF